MLDAKVTQKAAALRLGWSTLLFRPSLRMALGLFG